MRRFSAAAVAAALIALALAGGCARRDVLTARLRDVPDDFARRVLSDAIWAGGDIYRWASHTTLRLEVVRTDHIPGAESRSDEVWLLDLVGGRVRIEKTAVQQVTVYDGASWRVFVQGKETRDLESRARAAGDVAVVRGLATLPFSLLDPSLKIIHVGSRTGPGEARAWDRLLVTAQAGSGLVPGDRTLLEFSKDKRRIDAACITWSEEPFLGGSYRVEMDEWWPTADLALARRMRFAPVNDKGEPAGPVRWTFEVRRAAFDVPVGLTAFSQP
ncbi:MAG: hypothetical protein NTY65_10835 [Planctomycetota bacterium]|nr:hypothetical protein [Planctomycetota bacterium]